MLPARLPWKKGRHCVPFACFEAISLKLFAIPDPPVQLLPTSSTSTQQRLAAVQQELDGLEQQQQGIGRRARWRQAALVWGGLGGQVRRGCGQLA